jgi:hypothetical protein
MSQVRPFLLILIPLGGAAVAFGTWKLATARGAGTGGDSHEAEMRVLRAQVAELARGHAARANLDSTLVSWRQAVASASEVASAEGAAQDPKFKSPEEWTAAREERQREASRLQSERRMRMDDELGGEPRDPQWSGAAASTVETWLKVPELAGYSLDSMDCGTTLCRLKMHAPSDMPESAQLSTLLAGVTGKMGDFGTSSLSIVQQPDGSSAILAYLGRTGEPLPR